MIGLYGVTIGAIGFRLTRKTTSSEEYFLAGAAAAMAFHWGIALCCQYLLQSTSVGLAGSGYADGMAVGGFEWMAVFCLMPLIFLFLPFYIRNKIFTVPEFLERTFQSIRPPGFLRIHDPAGCVDEAFNLVLGPLRWFFRRCWDGTRSRSSGLSAWSRLSTP